MTHNWNAYVWWYLQRFYSFIGDGEEGTVSGEVLRPGHAFTHFSRFIRPGYHRMKVNASANSELLVTGYAGSGKTVYVLINPTDRAFTDTRFGAEGLSSVMTYTTTVQMTMEKAQAEIAQDNTVSVNVAPGSVITIVME